MNEPATKPFLPHRRYVVTVHLIYQEEVIKDAKAGISTCGHELYSQSREEIDLDAIIAAVNGWKCKTA